MNDTADNFDNFLNNHRTKALQAWVRLGLIDATDVPNLQTAQVTDKVALKNGGTWDVLVAKMRAQAIQYVNDHFPSRSCAPRATTTSPRARPRGTRPRGWCTPSRTCASRVFHASQR
jgi:hypothetical protein